MAKKTISYTTFKGIAAEERAGILSALKVDQSVIDEFTKREAAELEAKLQKEAERQAKRNENIKKNNVTFTIDDELDRVRTIKIVKSDSYGLAVGFPRSLDANAIYIARSVSAKDCTLVHGAITAKKSTNHQKRLVQNNLGYITDEVLPQILDNYKNMKELVDALEVYKTAKGNAKFEVINLDELDLTDKKAKAKALKYRVYFTASLMN